MGLKDIPLYFRYWGKANNTSEVEGETYHLLVYHCLDVAAVAYVWWNTSKSLRRQFCQQSGLCESQTKAWLLFFIALHDLGKFDVRFQLKAKSKWYRVNPSADCYFSHFSQQQINDYYHGPAGVYWLYQDWKSRFVSDDDDFFLADEENKSWTAWQSWLAPVAGHHGSLATDEDKEKCSFGILPNQVSDYGINQLKNSRQQWLEALESLFLNPAGLMLENDPPKLLAGTLLAGFCSVSDWLGSSCNAEAFEFDSQPSENLKHWFDARVPIAKKLLCRSGIIGYKAQPNPSVASLLKQGHQPRQVQSLVGQLPLAQSLTLVEASTGSGKTEAALAHAWQLLEQNLADSIVFALPTQATANAMLSRIEDAAPKIFQGRVNAVLAHGRSRFQKHFINLKEAFSSQPAQGQEEALVQCASWLSESKKRVFLGQIGICTVDQVLVSVLPVRHKFVRGFGVGRSVLIIDEIHAYDAYMYGLLEELLKQHRTNGGSAILLSATLPDYQKQRLVSAWKGKSIESIFAEPENAPYPLITSYAQNQLRHFDLPLKLQPEPSQVHIEIESTTQLSPNDDLLERMILAAVQGAQVCLICNLVDVAQQTLQRLREKAAARLSDEQFILFHSRFTFFDRQNKEEKVLELFGSNSKRQQGHILVSTQVFECSIDADMDWMISQICPVDLLFQRLGRLHRHKRDRPQGFEKPTCTVLVPTADENYELHGLIYGDSRILWRTQQLLEQAHGLVAFPIAYRQWIESVYASNNWGSEPEWVLVSHQKFEDHQLSQRSTARQLIHMSINVLKDSDSNITAVTRDGEMSLILVPFYYAADGKRCLLDGSKLDEQEKYNRAESISLNSLGVPASWNQRKNIGQLPEADDEGLIWLEMQLAEEGFRGKCKATSYFYHQNNGFHRSTEES